MTENTAGETGTTTIGTVGVDLVPTFGPPPNVWDAYKLAQQAAAKDPVEIGDGRVAFVLGEGQSIETVDTSWDRAAPARKTGTSVTVEAASFVQYVKRHATVHGTTLWANVSDASLVAVLDDHHALPLGPDGENPEWLTPDDGSVLPGWGQHRAVLKLTPTAEWLHWTQQDGKYMTQDAFAEHIEDGVSAIVSPDAATMLELVQAFHVASGASFDSSRRLGGDIQFKYTESQSASAGELEIPAQFQLDIAPFEGTETQSILARFRYRLVDKRLSLGFRLIRPEEIRRQALNEVIDHVETHTGFDVMLGVPAVAR